MTIAPSPQPEPAPARPSRRAARPLLAGLLAALAAALPLRADTLDTAVGERLNATLEAFAAGGDAAAARGAVDELFDQVVAYADESGTALLVETAVARRMVTMLADLEAPARGELARLLLERPRLAVALLLMIRPELESPEEIFAVLRHLAASRGDQLEPFANLAAAICVVHDRAPRRRVNENVAVAADPLALFDYFVANEPRMLFGIRDVPPELLVYVVDSTASIQEMSWALGRYAGDTNVGARFFDIEYDHQHVQGAPKKVTQAGWNLPNILQYGGVCADQAYFASTVGKSIGVPATYTRGRSGEVSHAWVGFLQSDGRRAWWNFGTGRYGAYLGVRGNVVDPQINRTVPDAYVSLLADHAMSRRADREAAAALTDAAARLDELRGAGRDLDVPPPEGGRARPRRETTVAAELDLLEQALRSSPGYARAWSRVQDLAAGDELSLADKKRWAEVLHRLCGERYPDFYLEVLEPMVATVEDPAEQNKLWNAAFRQFQARPDLAASVRLAQAQMWLEQDEPVKAGRCYEDVIERYANAGPFVLTALREAEKLLRTSGDPRRVLALYDIAWRRTKFPDRGRTGVFFHQSNWYRIGSLYATRLEQAGLARQAASVRATLANR
ncbi:MAG: hypothetical protein ACYTJ0_19300 [Planctomycetota bacterium]|jgi:hypothetical protein